MRYRYWADALRVAASFMVVIIHVCGVGWYAMEPRGADWWTINILDSLCRCSVPLFFMLSGAMMLDRQLSGKYIIRKTARLIILWFLAAAAYAVLREGVYELATHPVYFLQLLLDGNYHLWFLLTLAGIYLLLPVLKALVSYDGGKWVPWYLAVFFLFGIVRQSMNLVPIEHELWSAMRKAFVPELCQYSGYFVLGWYLSKREMKVNKGLCIAAFVISSAVIAVGTHLWSLAGEGNDERMYAYLGLPVFLQAAALFVLGKGIRPGKGEKLVRFMSPLTLGIYLIHPAVIRFVTDFGELYFSLPGILSVPAAACLSFIVSAAMAWLLRKIPTINRLL